jgi:hypothetical protein
MEMETIVGDQLQPAIIKHGMGRHPVVQVYQLVTLPTISTREKQFKLCFCGPPHHNDPEAKDFKTKSWDERHWGDQVDDEMIENLAHEVGPAKREQFRGKFKDDFTLNVWLSNLEEVLFEPGPGQYHFDMGDVYRTEWVRKRETMTVEELKRKGEWPARFVYRPRLIRDKYVQVVWVQNEETEELEAKTVYTGLLVEIFHLNLNEIEIAPLQRVHRLLHEEAGHQPVQPVQEVHFMVLLRS